MSQPGASGLRIDEVKTKADLDAFIDVPWTIYKDDPAWSPPLRFERRDMFGAKNPYFEHAEAAYFIARRDGKPVGRISAQVDDLAQRYHGEGTGHFGALEGVDDPEVFAALFETAEAWLRDRGMTRVLGPFTLSINEETGLLIDGFEHPPRILMGHAKPWYGPRVEDQGYIKSQDMWAYDLDITKDFPPAAQRIIAKARQLDRLKLRRIDKKRFNEELHTMIDIFNDAWRDNWGFIPMTEAEIDKMGADLKPFVKEEGFMIAEWDGVPTAFMLTIPDVNQAARDLNGSMLPFGWAKLAWRLILHWPTQARVPLMGVRKDFQGTMPGAAMAMLLIETIREACVRVWRLERGELSWILESNPSMHKILTLIGCVHYKTYRVYEKAL